MRSLWRRTERLVATSGRTAWTRNLAAPIREFLGTESLSAGVLLAAALAALVWANLPWWHTYEDVWTTDLALRLGGHELVLDLRSWVNEGLMTLFFLVIGLEAKRELDMGELRERGRIGPPVIAALSGMAVPVAIFLALNASGHGAAGWGAAMSTDTAFALGALTLFGRRGSGRLRVMLLTIVVVDDFVALLVITLFYADGLAWVPLVVAIGLFAALVALRFVPGARRPLALMLGMGIWVALRESGVDPLIGGLAIGLAMGAYPPTREDLTQVTDAVRTFREQPTPRLARAAQRTLLEAISPNERLQHRLHPWTSHVVVPLFALANAGVHLTGGLLAAALTSTVTIGIVVAYVVGKPTGILGATWLARRSVLRGSRMAVTWPGLAGVGCAAGIGFTVSLLIASMAFSGRVLDEARIGILATIVLAPALTWMVFRLVERLPAAVRLRQFGGLAEDFLDLAEDVDPERDHVRGIDDAPVTIVEYADFECEFCGHAEPVIRDLLASFGDDLRYVFRHLPLSDVHPHAQIAAEASEAAAAQGGFWEMHDALIEHQDALDPESLRRLATRLGLDVERFWSEVRDREHAARVSQDVASADESGVTGTPTLFVNGRRLHGAYDAVHLASAVRAARERALVTRQARSAERPSPVGPAGSARRG